MKNLLFLSLLIASLCTVSCKKDKHDEEPDFSDITLLSGSTYDIPGGNNITWTSANDYIAKVEGGTILAGLVGRTTISSRLGSFNVTVEPTLTLFKEPCIDWGASKSIVKSYMSGYEIYEENATGITYTGIAPVSLYLYDFENSKLSGSGVSVMERLVDSAKIGIYLAERYILIKTDEANYSLYFISPDEQTLVLCQLTAISDQIFYILAYVPYSGGTKADFDPAIYFKNYMTAPAANAAPAFERLKSMFK